MRGDRILAALGLSLALACRAADPAPADLAGAEFEQDVATFLERYVATLESGSDDELRRLFVEDARFAWSSDGERAYSSADEVVRGREAFADLTFRTELSRIEAFPLGARHAGASASFRTRIEIPGAADHEFGGVLTFVLERSVPGGPWRVLAGHTSTPGGRPASSG